MGISLRHHVLTLVAVFLMLLVGLLVGVGLSSQPELTARIDDLASEFQKLMGEIHGLERDAGTQEDFATAAMPKLVGHKLDGKQIPLIVTAQGPVNRVVGDVTKALQAAGAEVPYRLTVRSDLPGRAARALGEQAGDPLAQAAGRIAAAVAAGDAAVLHGLEKDRLAQLGGRPTNAAPSGVVVLGGSPQPPAEDVVNLQRPIVEALLAAGVRGVVGCESRALPLPNDTYRDLEISTVDNVELVRGQVSLVLALAGKPGRYGDGPTAEQEFAPLE
jgi:outer membrane murein-binding lipoprotein Lpp